MFIESLGRMKAHESTEREGTTVTDDKTLIGLIHLNNDLLDIYIENSSYDEIVEFT